MAWQAANEHGLKAWHARRNDADKHPDSVCRAVWLRRPADSPGVETEEWPGCTWRRASDHADHLLQDVQAVGKRLKDHAEDGGSAKSRCGFHLQWVQRYCHKVF